MALQVMAGNPAILLAMAAALGYTCVPALPDQAAGDPVEAFVALQQEVGEFRIRSGRRLSWRRAMVSRNEISGCSAAQRGDIGSEPIACHGRSARACTSGGGLICISS